MAEGENSSLESDYETDYEKIGQSSETFGNRQNLNITSNKTYIGRFFNISRAKSVTINQNVHKSSAAGRTFDEVIHGTAVSLSNGNTRAERTGDGYQHGLCFVSENSSHDKAVHFRILETFEGKHGKFRLGFLKKDPNFLHNTSVLQKPLLSVKSCDDFIICEPSMDTCAYPNAVIYFSFSNGKITFCSSKDDKQEFPYKHKPDTEVTHMWAFIELLGQVTSVEVVNNRFHDVHGCNITTTETRAARGSTSSSLGTKGGYVCFTQTPVAPGMEVEFKLTSVQLAASGHMRVGLCTDDPAIIPVDTIPASVTRDDRFRTIDLGSEDATCQNVISLVPVEQNLCVYVNNTKQVGYINIGDKSYCPVLELFGNTKSVEVLASAPFSEPQVVSYTEEVDTVTSPAVAEQVSALLSVWLQSHVVVNHIKSVAMAIACLLDTYNPCACWNRLVDATASVASYVGLAEYVFMVEVGNAPSVVRADAARVIDVVVNFASTVGQVKEAVGGLTGTNDKLQLLRCIVGKLPRYDIRYPKTTASSPPAPSPFLLNLSCLPTDVDVCGNWMKQVIVKVLLDTANKIEASMKPMEGNIRKLYTLGI
ncbi:uncharacterized protein LOC124267972 [Haliotis rubra]|uniref:uncharacterized protein LOC124267972 n=1 Tax=Haliotis rubra TaxID=36100 RepID=UPI001EE5A935|nr:uncharacterized protein LOC124267972 [Haliotis rubra]XP_046558927.1 uncharacterized protein LOC124267972 [Haliotis rubra]